MPRILIGLIIGMLVGGALVFYFFVGVPRAGQNPGVPIQRPDATQPAGTAQITLKQDFFNQVLAVIFRDMNDPAFQLASSAPSNDPHIWQATFQSDICDGRITVLQEGSGVATAVRFENNQISAPLAFSGSYNSPVGCLNFTGWAQATLELRYDAASQSVFGQINVETVNLDGLNPILGGFVTPMVQTTLNNRVNPIAVLSGQQIAINAPIASAAGVLKANVQDVRAEIKDNALNLFVSYNFTGGPSSGAPTL